MKKVDLTGFYFAFYEWVPANPSDNGVYIIARGLYDQRCMWDERSQANVRAKKLGFRVKCECTYGYAGAPEEWRDRLIRAGAVEKTDIIAGVPDQQPYSAWTRPHAPSPTPAEMADLRARQARKPAAPGRLKLTAILRAAIDAARHVGAKPSTPKEWEVISAAQPDGDRMRRVFHRGWTSELAYRSDQVTVWTDAGDTRILELRGRIGLRHNGAEYVSPSATFQSFLHHEAP